MSTPFVSSLRTSLGATGSTAKMSAAPGSIAGNTAVMSLFSDLDLALDASGAVVSTANGGRSAAKDLLASKNAEKLAEAELAASHALKKQQQKQKQASQKKEQPVTALSQALGLFDQEMDERDSFMSRNTKRRQKGSKKTRGSTTTPSRGRRQRHENMFISGKTNCGIIYGKRPIFIYHTTANEAEYGSRDHAAEAAAEGELCCGPDAAHRLPLTHHLLLTPLQRSGSNRRNSSSSTAHGTASRASTSSASGPARAFRGPQRPRSRTAASSGPPPAAVMAKMPSVLLRPDRDSYLQTNARSSGGSMPPSSPMERRTGSPGRTQGARRPSTIQQTKIVPPSTSVKLITPQMQFATDLSVKLGGCLELTNFTVVGVFGLGGVGKSTVLSLLAQKNLGEKEDNLFSTRGLEALVMDRHETTGVDLAVSMAGGAGHPTVLLDSQPLLSSSMLADLLERNETPRFGALTPEQQVEAASYQIAVFLCAICHYVVVVHDGLAFQVSVNELLRKVEQKFGQCRLPSVSGNSQRHAAQLLYVANNVADSELLYRENELFSAHERALEAAWYQALVRVPYKMSGYSDPADGAFNVASFVLPHRQQQLTRRGTKVDARQSPASGNKKRKDQNKTQTTFTSSKYSDFDEAAEDFRRFVLSLPSSPSFTSHAMPMLAMTPGSKPLPPPHTLSLREWLSNASRVFEAVRKAGCFTAEYASSRDHH
ncbi:smg-9, nonsense mediated mRNA decay factor [Phytophthora pseudosyringae]|uniref:Smg-9, nonsense mediated mRNA decay factor n=1 Tax=Phytophthora pseudosyringae TaxID=221518 RepID=A0A8T1VSQ3_9STRA|nr:smg-9, nonsense mediated mRNA decay factor [Phytophthora pseudosyringae]